MEQKSKLQSFPCTRISCWRLRHNQFSIVSVQQSRILFRVTSNLCPSYGPVYHKAIIVRSATQTKDSYKYSHGPHWLSTVSITHDLFWPPPFIQLVKDTNTSIVGPSLSSSSSVLFLSNEFGTAFTLLLLPAGSNLSSVAMSS